MRGCTTWILLLALAVPGGATLQGEDAAANAVAQRLLELAPERREAAVESEAASLDVVVVRELVAEGDARLARGPGPDAQAAYDLALAVARRIGDPAATALALRGRADADRLAGRPDEAATRLEEGLKLAEPLQDRALEAQLLSSLGLVRQAQGSGAAAIELLGRSLALVEEDKDPARLPRALSNLGVAYGSVGDYSRAVGYFQRSLEAAEQLEDLPGTARALNNLGNAQRRMGNNTGALESLGRSLELKEKLGQRASLPTTLKNLGQLHQAQGQPDEAIAYFERGLALAREMGDRRQEASLLSDLGYTQLQLGRLAPARATLERCLALFREVEDKSGVVTALSMLGEARLREGDLHGARDSLAEAARIDSFKADAANWLRSQAELELLSAAPAKALEVAEQATALARDMASRDDLWSSQWLAGRAWLALGRREEAQRSFEQSVATIESLRAESAGGDLEEQRFLEDKTAPYEALIEMLADARPAEALAIAERSRARVLADVLQRGHVRVTRSLSDDERRQEEQARARLVDLNTALRDQPDAERRSQLQAELQQARLEHELLLARLYGAHPELRALRGEAEPAAPDLAALVGDARTALLEYVVAAHRVWLFVVTRDAAAEPRLGVYRLGRAGEDVPQRARELSRRLAARDLEYATLAAELYGSLLLPAEAQLRGRTRWIIVPDGPLWELPYQALRTPAGRYVVEERTVSYAPSLTVLAEMKRHPRADPPSGRDALVVANPTLGARAQRRARSVSTGASLTPLPEAEVQGRAVAGLYGDGARLYVGAQASEESVKQDAGRYRILHFATHGLLDDASPMYSQLVLAEPGPGSREDGLLEAREIVDLDLHASLAVLSACDTGRGRVRAGEGLVGLAWAFFVAGCPVTVVSHWKVEASATAELMVAFHREVKLGSSPAEALRTAAQQLLRKPAWRHPFFWAAFEAVGDAEPRLGLAARR